MRTFACLEQDKSASTALVETSSLKTAAVGGDSPIIQRKGTKVMEVSKGQVIDAASAQGAQGNRLGIRGSIALPDLSVQHHYVDAGGIKLG